ncbi:hypothetical protein WJX82_001450 [Trebouxia sp. C0006]
MCDGSRLDKIGDRSQPTRGVGRTLQRSALERSMLLSLKSMACTHLCLSTSRHVLQPCQKVPDNDDVR